MSCTRYKAGPHYDGSNGRDPWKGFTEVNEAGQWRDPSFSLHWQHFTGVTLDELVSSGYWQLEIPEELRVSEGL